MKKFFIQSGVLLLTLSASFTAQAQKVKTNTAKLDFQQFPSLPAEGMKNLGIQIYTANLPFNMDTLRLYLGNMDIMKSNVERMSKVGYQFTNEVEVVGGSGDITVEMAFGEPMVVNKELLTTSCAGTKEGCTQYYYMISYVLPTVVQAKNSSGVLEAWELSSEMTLSFGNEQVEKHKTTDKGSSTSISVINYKSEADLKSAFAASGEAALARKGIVVQMGKMAESIYDRLFFENQTLKLDIAYGSGKATDYTETEQAANNAVEALEKSNYSSLESSVSVWNNWLAKHDKNDKKAAVNDKVAQGLHENLSIAYLFLKDFEKARNHTDSALKLAQNGFVNQNEVKKLQEFKLFIDRQEKVQLHNANLSAQNLVLAPDIKQTLGRRKFNENLNFFTAQNKYAELAKNLSTKSTNQNQSLNSLEALMNQPVENESVNSSEEVSIAGRVQNNLLMLSVFVDGNMKGTPLSKEICDYPEIKTISAVNIGLIALPACMESLHKLEKLILSNNAFTELPDMFAGMKDLSVLNLANNQLTSLPSSLYLLSNLKKIDVSGNNLPNAEIDKLKKAFPNAKIKL
jgi:hypothetical protein